MPKALSYIRVSTGGQAEGELWEEQRRTITRLHETHVRDKGYPDPPLEFKDLAVSAGEIEFEKRKGAAHMLAAAERGDAILFVTMDRAFRDPRDMLVTMDRLNKAGIRVFAADMGGQPYDSESLIGQLMMFMSAWAARWEYERACERNKARVKACKAVGRPYGGVCPFGFKHVRDPKNPRRKIIHPEDSQRAWMRWMYEANRKNKYPMRDLVKYLNDNKVVYRKGRPFTLATVLRIIRREEVVRNWEAQSDLRPDGGGKFGYFIGPSGQRLPRLYPCPVRALPKESAPADIDAAP